MLQKATEKINSPKNMGCLRMKPESVLKGISKCHNSNSLGTNSKRTKERREHLGRTALNMTQSLLLWHCPGSASRAVREGIGSSQQRRPWKQATSSFLPWIKVAAWTQLGCLDPARSGPNCWYSLSRHSPACMASLDTPAGVQGHTGHGGQLRCFYHMCCTYF